MEYFLMLPEDCISRIVSLTSPADAARSSVLSKGFNSAVDSDIVWGNFLPSDVDDIISRSGSSLNYTTKKELYISLCDSPLVLDQGKVSFSLDKKTGNKCCLIAARELSIIWGATEMYWRWKSHSESRFSEVAELRFVCWLDIRGIIWAKALSLKCDYAAYLVFQLTESHEGLESAEGWIRFPYHETDDEAQARSIIVHLAESRRSVRRGGHRNGKEPRLRADGWLEVELGRFNSGQGDDGEVEARLKEIKRLDRKSGLIVEGIEFRPV